MKRIFNYFFLTLGLFTACSDSLLEEVPLDELSNEQILISPAGFENYIIGLHESARLELFRQDGFHSYINQQMGTDIACSGETAAANFRNYIMYLTPTVPFVERFWDWAYRLMLLRANTTIVYAERPDRQQIWQSEEQK